VVDRELPSMTLLDSLKDLGLKAGELLITLMNLTSASLSNILKQDNMILHQGMFLLKIQPVLKIRKTGTEPLKKLHGLRFIPSLNL
jgi:hypothetical protein